MKAKTKRRKFYLIAFIFLSLFICVESCLPSGISSIQSQLIAVIFNKGQRGDKEVLPTSLEIEGKNMMQIGDTQQLKVNFMPEKVSDTRITWSMEETDLASLSSSGVITALKEGTVIVRATSNVDINVFNTITIDIEPVPLKALLLSYEKDEISVGTTTSIKIQYEPSNTTNKGIEWISTDEKIATINERGIVKGIKVGSCQVYAKSEYYGIESRPITITVNNQPVIPVTEINYSDKEEPIYVTQSLVINPIFNEGASDQSFYMESSDSSIFSVSNNKIIGKKEGSAYLTIISNADESVKSREILIQVKEVNAIGIQLLNDKYYYQQATKIRYRLISENENIVVTNQKVFFSIEKNDFCTIDSDGTLYAKKVGKIEITILWDKDSNISLTQEIEFVLPSSSFWGKLNRFTRKIVGHFSLFLLTGTFGMLTLVAYQDKLRYFYALLINFGYGFILGGISELLQLIPEGRACQFKDVLIDTLGYVIGAFIVWLFLVIHRKRSRAKVKKEENV